MCGPLALALPSASVTNRAFVLGRVAYNAGRVFTYATLGAVCGLLGGTLALAGWQRWISLLAGGTILVGWLATSRLALNTRLAHGVAFLKMAMGQLLRSRSLASLGLLGALNGLLPCGLVYVAGAGAIAAGGAIRGAEYMLAFGLGTTPMMLAIALAGKKFQFAMRFRFQRLIPACLIFMAAMLILRGLSLGIPYLSPDLAHTSGHGMHYH